MFPCCCRLVTPRNSSLPLSSTCITGGAIAFTSGVGLFTCQVQKRTFPSLSTAVVIGIQVPRDSCASLLAINGVIIPMPSISSSPITPTQRIHTLHDKALTHPCYYCLPRQRLACRQHTKDPIVLSSRMMCGAEAWQDAFIIAGKTFSYCNMSPHAVPFLQLFQYIKIYINY